MLLTPAAISTSLTSSATSAALGARAATFGPVQEADLAALEWLEGEWQRDTARGVVIERWRRVAEVGLVGESTVLAAGTDTEVFQEALLLVAMGADIFYIPRPAENPYPVGFRLVSLADGTAVFENPTHDFPQRIIHRRTAAAAMPVSIEGPGAGGEARRIDFEFVRR